MCTGLFRRVGYAYCVETNIHLLTWHCRVRKRVEFIVLRSNQSDPPIFN